MRGGFELAPFERIVAGHDGEPVRCLPKVVHPDVAALKVQHNPQILLVLKTPIHAQQDIETPLSTPKQLTVRRARPACGLHGAGLVSPQLGGESTRQILVKQNAHGPERNSEPDRARRVPVALSGYSRS